MQDSGFQHVSFRVDVLNRTNILVGQLEEVTGGTLTCSVDARIKTGGSIDIVTSQPIDWWEDKRLQIWADVNGEEFSLGVFIPSSPRMKFQGGHVEFSAELSDMLCLLDQDAISEPLSLIEGLNIDNWLYLFVEQATGVQFDLTLSKKTLSHALNWDAGTSKLTIVNDILDYLGYFSLEATPEGTYRARPYVIPADRPIDWQMREGEDAWMSASFTHEQDWGNVPNKVIYITQSTTVRVDGATVKGKTLEPLIAVATNTNPDSWASYQRRGRWIVEVKTDAEADSQEELLQKATKRLENALEPYEKLEINNLFAPIRLNDLIRFTSTHYDLVGTIRKIEIPLTPGELMKTTIAKSNYEIK